MEASLASTYHQTCFLAASSQHSGDWLFALPTASCRLKLDDEAVRVAVSLRLGMDLCQPHQCSCGSLVDARGLHSFVCKRALGRTARHHALNDLIARSFVSAGVPVTKEPVGLFRTDGLTLIPWQSGKSLCWDVMVTCPVMSQVHSVQVQVQVLRWQVQVQVQVLRNSSSTSTSTSTSKIYKYKYNY